MHDHGQINLMSIHSIDRKCNKGGNIKKPKKKTLYSNQTASLATEKISSTQLSCFAGKIV